MKARFFSVVAALAAALSLTACGEDMVPASKLAASQQEVKKLKPLAEKLPQVEAELKRTAADLKKEIEVKKKLAVENTRLKGKNFQAVADLSSAHQELARKNPEKGKSVTLAKAK